MLWRSKKKNNRREREQRKGRKEGERKKGREKKEKRRGSLRQKHKKKRETAGEQLSRRENVRAPRALVPPTQRLAPCVHWL